MFALRLDVEPRDKDSVKSWLDRNSKGYFVVHETVHGENDHIHAVIETDKNLNALRVSFKRAFPNKIGNGQYSLKECDADVENYMLYMCKGDSVDDMPVVWLRNGLLYTDDKIKEWHNRYWVNNEQLTRNKRKRAESGNMVERLERLAKEKGLRSDQKDEIAKLYIKEYVQMRKGINVFAARAVVNTVSVLLDEDRGQAEALLACQIVG